MKRSFLALTWSILLIMGVYSIIQSWTTEDLAVWQSVLLNMPLSAVTMWTFIMLYDIWITTWPKKTIPKLKEAPRVDMKTGGLIYVNNVLYCFSEMSAKVDYRETSSRIVLESVEHSVPFIHVDPVPSDNGN